MGKFELAYCKIRRAAQDARCLPGRRGLALASRAQWVEAVGVAYHHEREAARHRSRVGARHHLAQSARRGSSSAQAGSIRARSRGAETFLAKREADIRCCSREG